MAHNPVQHNKTKYIEIDRYFIKKKLHRPLCTPYVPINSQLADMLMKDLNNPTFHTITGKLEMDYMYSPT